MRATTASRWRDRSRAAVALRPTGPVSSPTGSARASGRLRLARDDGRPWACGCRSSRSSGRIGDPSGSDRPDLLRRCLRPRMGGWPLSRWPESLCVRVELSWDRGGFVPLLSTRSRPDPIAGRSRLLQSETDWVEQALRTELRPATGPVRIGPARPRGPVCGRLGRRRSAPGSIRGSGPGRPSGLAPACPGPLADRHRAPDCRGPDGPVDPRLAETGIVVKIDGDVNRVLESARPRALRGLPDSREYLRKRGSLPFCRNPARLRKAEMIADGLSDYFRIPYRRLGAAMPCRLPPSPVILGCGSEFDDGPG